MKRLRDRRQASVRSPSFGQPDGLEAELPTHRCRSSDLCESVMIERDLEPLRRRLLGAGRYWAILFATLSAAAAIIAGDSASNLRLATFQSDITPPVGAPMAAGFLGPIQGIEAPVLAKGVLLAEGTNRFVLCALDWCRLQNESYDRFREALARAARTSPSRVAVHCLHQHDSFLADHTAERLLQQQPSPPGPSGCGVF